jgi:hypothetical protein
MDLNIFKRNDEKEDGQEHYWSLVVGESWIQAGIWSTFQEKVHLIAQGNVTSWDATDEESLVSAADGTLSSAASFVTQDISEPNKVVFGLPASWVEEGDISKEKLNLLKKLTDELELSPAGFVVVPEAIVHYLKSKEGAPLNGILLGVSQDILEVSLVQNGKLLGSTEISRSVSLGTDMAEGLTKLSGQSSQFPTRILLYDHKAGNLDEARQNLLQTEWGEKIGISFLHTPKVEVLDESTAIIAVSLAGGAEVGQAKAIVVAEGMQNEEEVTEAEAQETDSSYTQEKEPVLDEEDKESETAQMLEDIGFLEDEDIAQHNKVMEKEQNFEENMEDFDFEQHDNIRVPSTPLEATPAPEPFPQKAKAKSPLAFLSSFSFLARFPRIRLPFGGGGMIGLSLIGLVLLLLFGGVAYWYLPKADVSIFVAPKSVSDSFTFTIDPNLSVVDQANSVVPGSFREIDVSGEKTASTTGTKTIGDRAKGTVTIVNTGGSRTLKSGTVLTGPNSLKFTLNDDVTIASASSALSTSQTQAGVSAGDIGAQYNLAQGSEFSVGNFSKLDVAARNDEAISGGSSREIAAVSDKDQASISQDLTQELIQKALDQAMEGLSPDEQLVEDSAVFTANNKTYSNKIGEEASTLKLALTGKVKVLIVPKDALQILAMNKVSSQIPQGFTLKPEQLRFTFKTVEQKAAPASTKTTKTTTTTEETTITSSKPQISTEVQANLLPMVNPDDIKKSIAGKKPEDAKEYLSTIPGFSRAEIAFRIKLPSSIQTLPRIDKNINIEVQAEQ